MPESLIQSLRDLILSFDHWEMAEDLPLVHDITLYSSDIVLEEKDKSALFQLKILWEGFEKIKEASWDFKKALGAILFLFHNTAKYSCFSSSVRTFSCDVQALLIA